MSKSRYKWWGYVKGIIREYPEMKRQYTELHSPTMMANYSVLLHFRRGEERFDLHHFWLCLQSPDLERVKAPWRDWETVTPVDAVEIDPCLLTAYIAAAAQYFKSPWTTFVTLW